MDNSNAIKILIVEDEALIAERIYADLQDYGYDVLEPCLSAEEAIMSLQKDSPDLVLLDINLKTRMTGLDIAAIINNKYHLPFIFLTANTDDATIARAAEVQPQAFLTKPIQLKTLIGTIQVAIYNHQNKQLQNVIDATAQYHFVKSGNKYQRIDWKDVVYIEADGKYSLVHLQNTPTASPIKVSLELLARQLGGFNIVRIHKSFLVNLNFLTAINGNMVYIGKNIELPVGDAYRQLLQQNLKMYN